MNRFLVEGRRGIGPIVASLRWQAASRVRQVLGRTGEFSAPEVSERATALSRSWDQAWPGSRPSKYDLAVDPDRWVRFHSLPGGKRYPDTVEEYDEVLRRHRIVLDELLEGRSSEDLLVIAEDYDRLDVYSGWSKRYLSGAWPWRTITIDGYRRFVWVKSGLSDLGLTSLLRACADDRVGPFILLPPDLSWIFGPYDGGADLVLATPATASLHGERHSDWRPEK